MIFLLFYTGCVVVGANVHLRTLLLKHWGLDGRATEDGRPFFSNQSARCTPNELHPPVAYNFCYANSANTAPSLQSGKPTTV
ncbi:MAG: hypothetical protein FWG68_06350 [Defluviitaleaceae bacterium]|nr:hypothetical protein [Defluviitaleaceae bacterium]